ncbi:MAG: ATP-dependent endonuclease [Thermoanaerobaculales bacterium]
MKIEGFRSIEDVELDGIGPLTCLVGRNSSGKSNVLRALNLFFNAQTELDRAIDFSRDHYAGKRRHRRKKSIAIEVKFRLPSNLNMPSAAAQAKKALGREFSIRRSWVLDVRRRPFDTFKVLRDGEIVKDGAEHAQQFLNLMTYRYLRNRTIPATLLREESQNIARSVTKRARGNQSAEALLTALGDAGGRFLANAARALQESKAPLNAPTISTPGTLGELLTVTGFEAVGAHGAAVRDEDWGAGHQALFLAQLLYAVDTDYSSSFGWKQATIWGVEEPESGLHRDLESLVAGEFRKWTRASRAKLQLLMTTHSPTFVMAADAGFWVEFLGDRTEATAMPIPELVRDADTKGVVGWIQPVLAYPHNPLVLVEGGADATALTHVARLRGPTNLRFLSLPALDPSQRGGGKDSIVTYLKLHSSLLPNRPTESPLVVLFDWDVPPNQLNQAKKAYGVGGDTQVLRMDQSHCDSKLGREFKGIERFYPIRLFSDGASAGEFAIASRSDGSLSISDVELERAKPRLLSRLLSASGLPELSALSAVIADLEKAVARRP